MIKKIKFLIILVLVFSKALAQTDSSSIWHPKGVVKSNKIISSKTFQMLDVPILLIATGFAYKPFDKKFQNTRENFIPKFNHSYDNITQYLPAVIMVGLKVGGVKSRSSWLEMITADAFSYIIMTEVVKGLKKNINVRRPDGSEDDSFPSLHTATAFMTASMFHKEYGHLSPWYSIGAYTLATTTQVTRMLNNRHWISDVMVGAAIGIISVEVGYLLADMIFKRGKDQHFQSSNLLFSKSHHPHFLGIYTGITMTTGNYTISNIHKMRIDSGSRVGIEGAWFMNPYLGIGGLFTASTSRLSLDEEQTSYTLNRLSAASGIYLSYPISPVLRLGTKALLGVNYIYKQKLPPHSFKVKDPQMSLQSGISISYFVKRNLGFKLFTDYSFFPSFIGNKASNEFTFGTSFDLIF